ncbi:Vacuolar protein 8 [Hypoxylon texense]
MQSYHYDNTPMTGKGEELPPTTSWTMSSQPFPYQRRRPLSQATLGGSQAALGTSRLLGTIQVPSRRRRKSNTWTSSSGDPLLLSEGDQVDDREEFINNYNHLASKYGIRQLVPGDFPSSENVSRPDQSRKGSWVSRAIRRTPSGHSTKTVLAKGEERQLRRRRSISDAALNLVHHERLDGLKNKDLQALVRLCGKSLFYLPLGFAPGSLVLPTCFRAVAQALVQHVDTRGLFRIPGSVRVVNTLYDYYCADRDADNIATTTRCPDLPSHIRCGPHDIASAFKRFLAGLPKGILGSVSLFDALVAIHCQLHVGPEYSETRQTKLRARLIALAIGTVKSQYQRELICAVFGLLCLIGRTAETAPREDEHGRPLPTTDLMGYNALGIVFGPLLLNDSIDTYKMNMADPAAGLVLLPVSPPKSRKERHRHKHRHKRPNTQPEDSAVEKIRIANNIAEMVIVHWREVVRQMRSLGTLKMRRDEAAAQQDTDRITVISSASDPYSLRKPPVLPGWDEPGSSHRRKDRDVSPTVPSPTPSPSNFETVSSSPSLRRSPSVGGSKAESKMFNADDYLRSHVDLLRPNMHTHKSRPHDTSSSEQVASGSEVTFHSVRSSVTAVGNPEEYLSRPGNHSSITKGPVSPGEFSLKKKSSSNRSLRSAGSRAGDYHGTQAPDVSPVDRWEALTRASQASTESLSQSINERRLKRSPGYAASRQSGESSRIPEWKRLLMTRRSAEKQKQLPAKLSPKKKSKFELSPVSRPSRDMMSPRKSTTRSPTKSVFGGESGSTSQRSTSKPANGVVKVMTALFNRPAKDSSAGPTTVRAGKTDRSSIDTASSIRFPFSRRASTSKSGRPATSPTGSSQSKPLHSSKSEFQLDTPTLIGLASSTNHSNGSPSASPSRTTLKDTPTRPPPVSLRPTRSSYFAPRKLPQASSTEQQPIPHPRDRDLDPPPSLGTMVPHLEEPPVAHHITFPRPPTPIEHGGHPDGSDDDRASTASPSPRPGSSGNSVLHAQVRSLQRALEARAEECAQLRRRLAARDDMAEHAGRLCEQLRTARREAATWRGRAEAAERRVQVFERFTARVRGLRDAVVEEFLPTTPSPAAAVDGQVDRLSVADGGSGSGHGSGHGHGHGHSQSGTSSAGGCSEHTENWEELRDRIRQTMKEYTAAAAANNGEAEDADAEAGLAQKKNKKKMYKGKGPWKKEELDDRTAQLWAMTEELLELDGRSKDEGEGDDNELIMD